MSGSSLDSAESLPLASPAGEGAAAVAQRSIASSRGLVPALALGGGGGHTGESQRAGHRRVRSEGASKRPAPLQLQVRAGGLSEENYKQYMRMEVVFARHSNVAQPFHFIGAGARGGTESPDEHQAPLQRLEDELYRRHRGGGGQHKRVSSTGQQRVSPGRRRGGSLRSKASRQSDPAKGSWGVGQRRPRAESVARLNSAPTLLSFRGKNRGGNGGSELTEKQWTDQMDAMLKGVLERKFGRYR